MSNNRTYKDDWRHKGLRKALVESLRQKGLFEEAILHAMEDIPRHYFLDQAFEEWAYRDTAFRIDADQTISQPFTVAFQTQLLEVCPTDKILEVGTGSGYQACVLYKLGAKVYSIERQEKLFHQTEKRLKLLRCSQIRTYLGDGYAGLPRYAPFQKIIVTAGAVETPQKLLQQLDSPGIMVIPIGVDDHQKMIRIIKDKEGRLTREEHGDFKFVPMLKGIVKD